MDAREILSAGLYEQTPEAVHASYDVIRYSRLSDRFPLVHETTNHVALTYSEATRKADELTDQDDEGGWFEAVLMET